MLLLACSGTSESEPARDGGSPTDTGLEAATDGAQDAVSDVGSESAIDTSIDVPDAGCTTEGRERDVWVWGGKVVSVPAERAAFFDFAAKHAVRVAYVESESFIKSSDTTALASFVTEANARCIGVELLFGRSSWALSAGHADAIALAKGTVKLTAGLAGAKPLGVHFDVEPYSLPEWSSDMNGTANQYLNLLEALGKELTGSGLRLVVDVPFWYDARKVTRGGSTRSLHELVIDRVDVVTLMDYRDHAAPPDGIIDNASTEIAYANGVKRRVVIGVETLCGLDPPLVTFCEEGAAAMDKALLDTKAAHGSAPSFGGFAVHHYESWKSLKP